MPDEPDTQDLKTFLTEWSHWLHATRIRMRWPPFVRLPGDGTHNHLLRPDVCAGHIAGQEVVHAR
jgi:hypothetical protein